MAVQIIKVFNYDNDLKNNHRLFETSHKINACFYNHQNLESYFGNCEIINKILDKKIELDFSDINIAELPPNVKDSDASFRNTCAEVLLIDKKCSYDLVIVNSSGHKSGTVLACLELALEQKYISPKQIINLCLSKYSTDIDVEGIRYISIESNGGHITPKATKEVAKILYAMVKH